MSSMCSQHQCRACLRLTGSVTLESGEFVYKDGVVCWNAQQTALLVNLAARLFVRY
jgi:hypothetical protein